MADNKNNVLFMVLSDLNFRTAREEKFVYSFPEANKFL
jgi:hypothetical protein